MKGVKTLRLFYNGKCIKAMSEGKVMESKSKGILIAKYKFDCSKADLFPEFNEGFEYTFVDEQIDEADVLTVDRETVTIMTYDAEPDEYGVLTTEYEVETPVLVNAGDIVTRSIYSNELPTLMRFGNSEPNGTDREKSMLELIYLEMRNITDASYMFKNCCYLTSINTIGWDTSQVTNMKSMFGRCEELNSINVSKFNTDNVTDLSGMFEACFLLPKIDVSNWNTDNVTDMNNMFQNCHSLESLDVSKWNTANVTNMQSMFYNCHSLTSLDVIGFDTRNVNGMGMTFLRCTGLKTLDLSTWDLSSAVGTYYAFMGCSNLVSLNLSNWNMNTVTGYFDMFTGAINLNNIIMNNSDYNSVNKVIEHLPTRTADNPGTLDVTGVDDYSQVDIEAAESKYWNIESESSYFILGKSKLGQAKLK